ncbi:hypothetical protein GF402_09925 [Candidatus Fermentibacteria bacterium]|nr:hypothetical protein [Candidatus Fermentibacteria bacterium]
MSSVWESIPGKWWIWVVPMTVFAVVGVLVIKAAIAIPPGIQESALPFLSRRTEVLVLGVFLIVGPYASCAALYLRMRSRTRRASRLREEGVPCRARILSIRSTGMTINDLPQYRIEVEVTGAGAPPFPAVVRTCLKPGQLKDLGPGSVCRTWLDPNNGKNLLVSFEDQL